MDNPEILDPLFREAVSAIDASDVSALERLLSTHPRLVRDRLDYGDGYFRQAYLLWFVAENPIRNGKLPKNIAQVTRAIIQAAQREGVGNLQEQLDYTLGLVCTGRVARECGVQLELIDLLIDAGASPGGPPHGSIAHGELAAAERLIERGGELTLAAALCLERTEDIARLARTASAGDRQIALAAAALYGKAEALAMLIDLGVDLNAYSPDGFHSHATALHHAVWSGSLDAVKVLVEAGAELGTKDKIYQGTPLGWAEYCQNEHERDGFAKRYAEIAAYLHEKGGQS